MCVFFFFFVGGEGGGGWVGCHFGFENFQIKGTLGALSNGKFIRS